MRGRDLSKSLDDKEVRRLRTLLADNPQIAEAPESGGDYPKMMFGKGYLEAEAELRRNADPLVKKAQTEAMRQLVTVVWDPEEETQAIEDDWRSSPADFLPPDKDPRIPRGAEGRRAAVQKKLTIAEERMRLMQRLRELEAMDPEAEPEPVAAAVKASFHTPAKKPAKSAAKEPQHVSA